MDASIYRGINRFNRNLRLLVGGMAVFFALTSLVIIPALLRGDFWLAMVWSIPAQVAGVASLVGGYRLNRPVAIEADKEGT